jgi:MFS transporter, PHS family, inorganic phosphate transporter
MASKQGQAPEWGATQGMQDVNSNVGINGQTTDNSRRRSTHGTIAGPSKSKRMRLPKVWRKSNVHPDIVDLKSHRDRERTILQILDGIGFNWTVFFAVGFGFLASSYSLFAMSPVSLSLYYVYPPTDTELAPSPGMVFNVVTLCAVVVGMVLGGNLADRYGRSFLYGLELALLIIACANIALSSQGYMTATASTMNVYYAITAWRVVLGLGVGAEYPMSAIIAAEFSSARTRGTMMASVFAMQSVGRLLAWGVGLGFLRDISHRYGLALDDPSDTPAKFVVDGTWRAVIGLAGGLALLSIILRANIPESPRYYHDIKKDLEKTIKAVKKMGGKVHEDPVDETMSQTSIRSGVRQTRAATAAAKKQKRAAPIFVGTWKYLTGKGGRWWYLFNISLMWLMMDICFYGTGLDAPPILSSLWLSSPPVAAKDGPNADWQTDQGFPNNTIDQVLSDTSARAMELVSISAVVGSLLAIPLINYFDRKKLLAGTSFALAVLFLAAGIAVRFAWATPKHTVGMVFFSLVQFLFSLGPNTLIFILPSEIFPTVYRGTCYGIAAAIGKVGAIIIQPVLQTYGQGQFALSDYMFIFMAIMIIVGVIAIWPGSLPDVQRPRKKRAEKGKGVETAVENGHANGHQPGNDDEEHEEEEEDEEDSEEDDDDDDDERTGWRKYLPGWLPRPLKNKTLEQIAPNPQPVDTGAAGKVGKEDAQQPQEGLLTGRAYGPSTPGQQDYGIALKTMGNSSATYMPHAGEVSPISLNHGKEDQVEDPAGNRASRATFETDHGARDRPLSGAPQQTAGHLSPAAAEQNDWHVTSSGSG